MIGESSEGPQYDIIPGMESNTTRLQFLRNSIAFAGAAFAGLPVRAEFGTNPSDETIAAWQRETDLVTPEIYLDYLAGKRPASGFASLEKLDAAFERILAEIRTTVVTDVPAVWLVYNMGVIVKTREALVSIDLVHRRACELVPTLDFALVTHAHSDHYTVPFYRAMNAAHKTVISNFLDNYGAERAKAGTGGFTRVEKEFRLKDVEIRTSYVDHNPYLVNFTTAFEIRVGKWLFYHSGDCGVATKLRTTWGRPDLWFFFPGCGVKVPEAYRNVKPRRIAFGHLWELAHDTGCWKGRLSEPIIKRARGEVLAEGADLFIPFWGERLS